MISTLHLYGPIADKFGKVHKFAVNSLTDCIAMLSTQFSKADIQKEFGKYDFELIRNDKPFSKYNIRYNFECDNEFHLIPVVAGADKGAWTIIAGVALVAVSFFIPAAGVFGAGVLTASAVGMMGAGLILSGIGTMMAPELKSDYGSSNSVDENPSYVFNGPVNVTEQGATIPVVFGEFMCGSIVIASELENEDE